MRVTYDAEADAAYISLTDHDITDNDITDIRQNLECPTPRGAAGEVIMDWKDGRLVGVEVLGASDLLHDDLLAAAQRIDE
ncbi:MAG: hypothetical protein JWQ19_3956 [Subtercola sp.]|nr:hypothetical protein [Subtercola sp.]